MALLPGNCPASLPGWWTAVTQPGVIKAGRQWSPTSHQDPVHILNPTDPWVSKFLSLFYVLSCGFIFFQNHLPCYSSFSLAVNVIFGGYCFIFHLWMRRALTLPKQLSLAIIPNSLHRSGSMELCVLVVPSVLQNATLWLNTSGDRPPSCHLFTNAF